MNLLWGSKLMSVGQIVERLPGTPLAYTTVQTVLKVLENKGHVRHIVDGRAYFYRAVITREAAERRAVSSLLKSFFKDDPGALALRLIEPGGIGEAELDRLEQAIRERRTRAE